MRIALVSREIYPLGSGGIGQFVSAAARLLSQVAEVTIFTTSLWEPGYQHLVNEHDPRLPGDDVRWAFVQEPTLEESEAWSHGMHFYAAKLLERFREVYADEPPDLIEFPDFLGEGFVTLQAAQAFDPFLARTRICVRLHTSAELCEVLDGYYKRDRPSQALHAMERYALAHADRLIWQGGDILGTYERYYGKDALAPATRIRYPYVGPSVDPEADRDYVPGKDPLRLLYAGRLERRKGVQNLIRAVTQMERGDFHLTLIGGDTATAPLGQSMRDYLSMAIAGDGRITLADPADRDVLTAMIRDHDVVVVPSLWECWPYAALEPLQLNRPVLGTPVGGLVELVRPQLSGWVAQRSDAAALEDAIEALIDEPAEIERMVREGAPAARARSLSDDHEILDGYKALLATEPARAQSSPRRANGPAPLVSAIVPYYRSARYLKDTIDSLFAQTYPKLEVVLVNDGSFEDEDWLLAELSARRPIVVVSQMNAGLGAARNFGILQSRGRYVFPLDADNYVAPEFVARCVEVLERRPDVAYVTSWSRYVDVDGVKREGPDLGYEPLGNQAGLNADQNVAGDAAAVIRRRLFDAGFRYSEELTSFEDWHLYRELQRSGHFGAVIPERLLSYRVRSDSLQAEIAQPRRERLLGEIEALIRENGTQWTSLSA